MKREKTLGFVLALLLFVASFSSLVVTGITILYSPIGYANAKIGLVGDAKVFESIVHPVIYKDLATALKDLTNGKIDAVVVFNENLTGTNYITVYIPKEDVKAIKVILFLRHKLEEYQNVLRRMRGIPTLRLLAYYRGEIVQVPEGYSLKFKFIYVMLIPLLALTTAVVSSALVVDSICEEFERKTLEVLLTAVDLSDIVLGKVLASIIISSVLTIFWLFMLSLNGIYVANPMFAFLSSITLSLLMTTVALLATSYEPVREKAQLVFSLAVISMIVLVFSSPLSPLGLLVKASAGSEFSVALAMVYVLASLVAVILAVFVSEKRLSKAIGLEV